MTLALITLDTQRLAAFVAAARLWLVELMAWLACVLGVERAVRAELNDDLRRLQHAVTLLALAQARPALMRTAPPPPECRRGGLGCPQGVRRGQPSMSMRLLWRCGPRASGLVARCNALRRALADSAAVVRAIVRRLNKAERVGFVLCIGLREAWAAQAVARVPASDTS